MISDEELRQYAEKSAYSDVRAMARELIAARKLEGTAIAVVNGELNDPFDALYNAIDHLQEARKPKRVTERWGIFDTVQKRWWPRAFATAAEAQAHYDFCKGPGSRGVVQIRPEEVRKSVG